MTEEWDNRGVGEDVEYVILTDEISKASFGLTSKEYRDLKGLEKENLSPRDDSGEPRDHMDDWELILTMIGEKATTDITCEDDSLGFVECKDSAVRGGEIAGNTRRDLERSLGKGLVSGGNYFGKKEKVGEKRKVRVR